MPKILPTLLIQCPKCKGGGKIPLSDELAEAFRLVNVKSVITASDLFKHTKHPAVPTAMNRRLDTLVSLGLIWRNRFRKNIRYSLKPTKI